ncbi:MAG: DUF805 domain-containing protein [Rhodobacteraceae bacterium]|nr:DUF805 domain-containing protein [Paracoccaceae bacterium]
MQKSNWYYAEGQQRHGPLDAGQMAALVKDRIIRPDTMVWQEGMANWALARDHFDFASGTTPPPLPQAGQSRVPVVRRMRSESASAGHRDGQAEVALHPAPPRSFSQAVSVSLTRYFTFSGRASRSEFWYFFLFTILIGLLAGFLDGVLFGYSWDDEFSPLSNSVSLALLIPSLSVGWRRLHDTGRSGWWIGGFWLAVMVTGVLIGIGAVSGSAGTMGMLGALSGLGVLVYFIVMLVFLCSKGDPGPNRFG